MVNVAFMFGAGAERDFKLPSGYEYLKESIFKEYKKKNKKGFTYALKNFFSQKYFNTYSYSKTLLANESLYKKMLKNQIFVALKNGKNIEKILTPQVIGFFSDTERKDLQENFIEYKDFIDNLCKENRRLTKKEEKSLLKTFKIIVFGNKAYNKLDDCFKELTESNSEGKAVINSTVSTAGILDGYFHSIVNPPKYGTGKFSKIFNYYWACYFCIIEKVVEFLGEDLEKFYTSKDLDYYKILSEINKFTKTIYDKDFPLDKIKTSYYSIIKQKLDSEKNKYRCSGVITTNYFHFAEKIINPPKVSYPNGQLKYFEFPELLEVRDASVLETECSNFTQENIFFPFIFGQSYLKPIVNKKQIDEFRIMSEILGIDKNCDAKTDCLVVVGYDINEDDCHVNEFLHEFLQIEDKHLFFLFYDRGNAEILKVKERIIKNLGSADKNKVHIVHIKENDNPSNSKIISEIFTAIDSIFQKITAQNINNTNINEANTFEQNASL